VKGGKIRKGMGKRYDEEIKEERNKDQKAERLGTGGV
jgi:hypothetical protein